ncbi:hypothetical protein HUA74_35330 [Myxococcus sp. CA051A]|uniref:hypothetical protein n=1 Tax=Myxococcus sp. CA051A TaxID=2741739 RepID=UPI00157B8A4F|nr:hypothetical protein [Myxococcus sp. CA051A]NTX65946.1 hypothetical protein [Myxococcus sp. CA051A]
MSKTHILGISRQQTNKQRTTMPETPSEKETREFLKSNQFNIEKIPESTQRTADFFAHKNNEKYLVEVTSKEPEVAFQEMLQTSNTKGLGTLIREVTTSDMLDGIVKKKTKQLRATDRAVDFRLLWLAGLHMDSEHLRDALMRTLYGLALVSAVRSMDMSDLENCVPTTHPCFYYDYYSFFHLPDLDGVIFSSHDCKTLFINETGNNASAFRNSEMCSLFKAHGDVVDPAAIRLDPSVLFIDHEIDRKDSRAQWSYLRKTYGKLTSRMFESHFQGIVPFKIST